MWQSKLNLMAWYVSQGTRRKGHEIVDALVSKILLTMEEPLLMDFGKCNPTV